MKTEKLLTQLPKLECDVCKVDIETLYNSVATIVAKNEQLVQLDDSTRHQASKKLLQAGRVVVLRDEVRKTILVLICALTFRKAFPM